MNPKQILLIVAARYRIALAVAVLTVAIAIPVILLLPRQYTAATTLVVDIRSPDPISAMLMPSSMGTQEDIIKSEHVARKVVRLLRLDENPVVKEQWREATGGRGRLEIWLGELLQRKLSVIPPRRDSNIVTIEYTAADPAFAAVVANAFAQAYVDAMLELKVEPAKQYARWFGEQSGSLREGLEKAQAKLSAFQQEKGLVAKDETVDAETARLAELTSHLTTLQGQNSDARSKERSSGADTLPEVLGNSVVQGLRGEIARQEAKLKEMGLGANHPQRKRMEAELAELKVKLTAETKHVATGYTTSGSVGRDNEQELQAAIEAQKKKLLELMTERDQLAVLQRDVDAAKNAYDAIARRYTQTSLESQANQTNVFRLSPAIEPLEPSFPKTFRFTVLSILGGILAGLGAAFLWELLDRRVRCVEDLAEMLQMPVLIELQREKKSRRPPALPPADTALAALK